MIRQLEIRELLADSEVGVHGLLLRELGGGAAPFRTSTRNRIARASPRSNQPIGPSMVRARAKCASSDPPLGGLGDGQGKVVGRIHVPARETEAGLLEHVLGQGAAELVAALRPDAVVGRELDRQAELAE